MPHISTLQGPIINWATGGFACVKRNEVYRYQRTYPNTFCLIWVDATVGGVVRDWVCQDVHYTDAGAFQALGGFWMRGVDGAYKPEQDWRNHPSPMRRNLYNNLRAQASAIAPDKRTSLSWATVNEFLLGLDAGIPAMG